MKSTIAAFVTSIFCAAAFAQAGYNGAAKSYVMQFWKSIEKIEALPNNRSRPALARTEIKMAETHLRNAKARDPALDVAEMEAALARVQGVSTGGVGDAKAAADAKKTTTQFMTRFGEPLVIGRGEGSADDPVGVVERKVAKFHAGIDAFLAGDMDEETLRRYESRIAERLSDLIRARGGADACVATSTEPKSAERCFSEMLSAAAFWEGAARIYPNNARFTDAAKLARDRVDAAGTKDQRAGVIAANVANKVAANRLTDAVMRDSVLESDFARVFTQSAPGFDVLRVNITSRDWSLERHPATGVILSRSQSASIGVKDSAGKCFHFTFFIEQPHVGGGFGASKRGGVMGRGEMLCESLK